MRKYALLVGIEEYRDPEISALKFARADAEALAERLKAVCGFNEARVLVGTGGPDAPDLLNILNALKDMAGELRREDLFLLFFAGHGIERDGRGYLLTRESSYAFPEHTSLSLELLRKSLERFPAARRIVVVDACRNCPDAARGDAGNVMGDAISRDIVAAVRLEGGGATTAFLSACSAGQRAYEWPSKGHGVFTHYLLEGIDGAAWRGDELEFDDLAEHAHTEVVRWRSATAGTCGEQTPWYEKFGAPARLTLARRQVASRPETRKAPPAARAAERHRREPIEAQPRKRAHPRVEPVVLRLAYRLGQAFGIIARRRHRPVVVALAVILSLLIAWVFTSLVVDARKAQAPPSHVQTPAAEPTRESAATIEKPTPAETTSVAPGGAPESTATSETARSGTIPVAPAAKPLATPAAGLRVPEGFRAKEGTTPEPYTNTGWAKEVVHEKTGIEMVFIPAGSFQMGSSRRDDQKPIHSVRITKPFYLGKYEVTQGEWQKVMGSNPSYFKGDRNPVERVSWDDCQEFLRNARDGLRLPTEAEWEYACRAGTTTKFCCGNSDTELGQFAWYFENSGNQTHPVGQKRPNAWGVYDMHGNVWEWCADWYGEGYYGKSPAEDPGGASTGSSRVLRGAAFHYSSEACCSANRHGNDPTQTGDHYGVRPAQDIGE